ncbi:MAG: metal ABC transporter solute-binding protein, Zn/Mn family [Candidatus Rifleibacteriota bacterium]
MSFAGLSAAAEKETLFVSILPQKFFLQQLTGDLFKIEVLVGPGMSPHSYEPLPQQMASLAKARVFMAIGLPFEKILLEKISGIFENLLIIDTDQGITRRFMVADESSARDSDHVHHAGCDHSAGTPDPHIWLDPQLVKIQARNMAEALIKVFPQHQKLLNANLGSFSQQLDEIDQEIADRLATLKGKPILVFHPAFGYFADRYGLVQHSIEIEGKEPTPAQLVKIIRKAKSEGAKVIFVQKQFPARSAQAIAESISGSVIQIDPLAENYFDFLRELAEKVAAGLQQ